MKKLNLRRALFVGMALLSMSVAAQNPIRVACVGNSITYGHGIEDREHDTYPAQLQVLMGNEYDVRNFGVSGTTAQKKGDFPWITTPEYGKALGFNPQIVVMKLGTNDSKPQNWVSAEAYIADVERLAFEFEALPTHPRIVIALPAKAYNHAWKIDDAIISNQQIPALTKLVERHPSWVLLDLHTATDNHQEMFPDGIHPTPQGAGLIARLVKDVLLNLK